jgi:uncharacterized protein (DUF2336 family)
MSILTRESIGEFVEEASWTARAKLVERVASAYAAGTLAPTERQIALELFRLTLYDAEPLVRRVLAEALKRVADLPREIVLGLAQDKPDVAAPFLAASPLLDSEDLGKIARIGSTAQRSAIALRPVKAALLPLRRREEPARVSKATADA